MVVIQNGSVRSNFVVGFERRSDADARERLLDRAMGPDRKRKSSEKLRRGRKPAPGLALAARSVEGRLIGSVRLWEISAGGKPMLLLGPLAVEAASAGEGVGSALMRQAISRATEIGHGAIILVGDAAYYQRFGFSATLTSGLIMPGPVERDRLLGLELQPDYLAGAAGLLVAGNFSGRLKEIGPRSFLWSAPLETRAVTDSVAF